MIKKLTIKSPVKVVNNLPERHLVTPTSFINLPKEDLLKIVREHKGKTFEAALKEETQLGKVIRTLVAKGVSKQEIDSALEKEAVKFNWDGTQSVMMWYTADIEPKFNKYDPLLLRDLANEISTLSGIRPLHMRPEEFKSGEMVEAIDILKTGEKKEANFLSANENNTFNIKIKGQEVKRGVNPMYLVALMQWCLDFITGGQLSEREEYSGLKLGRNLGRSVNK